MLTCQRDQHSVIMLTVEDRLIGLGLKLGADDYLTKPFAMMELLRIEALLRQSIRFNSVSGCL